MKKEVNPFDYAQEIVTALKKGILLTTKAGDKVNSMVIGWGQLGVVWQRPVFMVYVREGRFTREMLDHNPQFTVNIPLGEIDPQIIAVCGTKSGRDMDKIAQLGLHLEDGQNVAVPGIKELPLTLECQVIYRRLQDEALILPEIKDKFYPQGVDASAPGANGDYHVVYYGEIVGAYIVA